MKKKGFLKKLGYLALFLCLLLAYLIIYLFPALIDINRSRREVNNCRLRIQDLEKERIEIVFPDQREQIIFNDSDRRYWLRFPLFKSERDIEAYNRTIISHIKKVAGDYGIGCLTMHPSWGEPATVIPLGCGGNKRLLLTLYEKLKSEYKKKKLGIPNISPDQGAVSLSGNRIYESFFSIAFPARLESAARMMIGIVDFPLQIEIREVLIGKGREQPLFYLRVKCYCQMDQGILSEGHTEIQGQWVPLDLPAHRSSAGYIDRNSPLLLKPVYLYFSISEKEKKLPVFNKRILFAEKGGIP